MPRCFGQVRNGYPNERPTHIELQEGDVIENPPEEEATQAP